MRKILSAGLTLMMLNACTADQLSLLQGLIKDGKGLPPGASPSTRPEPGRSGQPAPSDRPGDPPRPSGQPSDPFPSARPSDQPAPDCIQAVVAVRWGRIPSQPNAEVPQDWRGGLRAEGGTVRLIKTLGFEPDTDKVVGLAAPGAIGWTSRTKPAFDGVLLLVSGRPGTTVVLENAPIFPRQAFRIGELAGMRRFWNAQGQQMELRARLMPPGAGGCDPATNPVDPAKPLEPKDLPPAVADALAGLDKEINTDAAPSDAPPAPSPTPDVSPSPSAAPSASPSPVGSVTPPPPAFLNAVLPAADKPQLQFALPIDGKEIGTYTTADFAGLNYTLKSVPVALGRRFVARVYNNASFEPASLIGYAACVIVAADAASLKVNTFYLPNGVAAGQQGTGTMTRTAMYLNLENGAAGTETNRVFDSEIAWR